jgi:uncharacterized membrane protein YkoI
MGLRLRAGICAVAVLAVLLLPAISPAGARDHDEARRAVEAGEIRPLTEILNLVRGKLPGEIVRLKIERENGLWVYEFRVVDSKGRLFEVYVDARTGKIKRIKEK